VEDGFTERVLDLVDRVPRGRVVTYGLIADRLQEGGARQVGRVMSMEGSAVTWWRVVRANGTLAPYLMTDAQVQWREERTPVVRGHVDMPRALWLFDA
jgi:methylated-DNA-protein-cysteine methyltransferase-like protein